MKQQRNSRQRQLVLDTVKAHKNHPTADEIYLEARAVDDKISRGTVYRNLNLLARNGEIREVRMFDADRYDRRLDLHHHLLCTCCGAVCDVPMVYHAELDRELAEKTGYTIELHRIVFEGLCPACQEKQDVKSGEK